MFAIFSSALVSGIDGVLLQVMAYQGGGKGHIEFSWTNLAMAHWLLGSV
jgi:hypothetical protein